MADISPPESTAGEVFEWLEPRLSMVLEQWKSWQSRRQLVELDESLIKEAQDYSKAKPTKKKVSEKDDRQTKISLKEPVSSKKQKTLKSKISISKELDKLFKKE